MHKCVCTNGFILHTQTIQWIRSTDFMTICNMFHAYPIILFKNVAYFEHVFASISCNDNIFILVGSTLYHKFLFYEWSTLRKTFNPRILQIFLCIGRTWYKFVNLIAMVTVQCIPILLPPMIS